MTTVQWIARDFEVRKWLNLKLGSRVAMSAISLRFVQSKLAAMHVFVTAFTLTRCAAIARPSSRLSVFF